MYRWMRVVIYAKSATIKIYPTQEASLPSVTATSSVRSHKSSHTKVLQWNSGKSEKNREISTTSVIQFAKLIKKDITP